MMRWIRSYVWLWGMILLSLAPSVAGGQTRFVTTRGKEFASPDGKPLLLKGINLDNYIAREDIHFIKQSGFNSVRIPFSFRLFVSDGTVPRLEGPGYELLDRVVDWCRSEGVYVILDMHAAPGGQTGDNIDDSWAYPFLFESRESQELTINLWRKLAARYRYQSVVIGYDLLNEPIAPYFDTAALNVKLEPLYRELVTAIREVDRNHIIFLGGAQWDTNFKIFGPPFDAKLAYTFHK